MWLWSVITVDVVSKVLLHSSCLFKSVYSFRVGNTEIVMVAELNCGCSVEGDSL